MLHGMTRPFHRVGALHALALTVFLYCSGEIAIRQVYALERGYPYTRGSEFQGVYTPMGNFHGYEGFTPPNVALASATTPDSKISQGAFNYSTPWGDSLHPGVHPIWPIPPNPRGPQLNPQFRQDLKNVANAPDSLRYGIQGAHPFSAFRKYPFQLGQIPHSVAWPYAGAPGGEPRPFLHTGKIPATWPNGRDTTGTIRASQSVLNPYGSNDAVRAGTFLQLGYYIHGLKQRVQRAAGRPSAYGNKRPSDRDV